MGAGNPSQALVSIGGGKLVLLAVKGRALVEVAQTALKHEVSCIDITPVCSLQGKGRKLTAREV